LIGTNPEEFKDVVYGNFADISILLKESIPEEVMEWMKSRAE